MAKPRVLVLVDDDPTRALIRKHLRTKFTVPEAEDGATCLPLVEQEAPDLVLLDESVPKRDTIIEIQPTSGVPVISLTSTGGMPDCGTDMTWRAHDSKQVPLDGKALVKRVQLMLKRPSPIIPGNPIITCGSLIVGLKERRAVWRGRTLELTRGAFDLLAFLAANAGQVVTRDQLVAHVCGEISTCGPHVLDLHITGIRKALGEGQKMLTAVQGGGYRLRPVH